MAHTGALASQRLAATFSALRYPNYRRWFVGQALSLIGTWMQSVAQGWLVYDLTGSKLALGVISFAGTVPSLFLMLPAGALVDRVPKRKLLIVTQTVMMGTAFALALLSATGKVQAWQIAVLAFIGGVAMAFDTPARLSLAADMVDDRRDLQNAIALGATMFNLARILGPAIGGIVLASMGATWCFILNGLSFIAVLIALVGMRLPPMAPQTRSRRLASEIAAGLRYVWDAPLARAVISLVGVASVFGFSYTVLLPAYAADVLHVGEAGLGMLNTAVGVGALAGSLVVANMGRSSYKGRFLTLGSLLFPIGLLGVAATKSYPLALFALGVAGFGFVSQNATSNTLIQSGVPDELRGRVMSVYSFMFFGTAPLGSLLAGALAQATGPSIAIAIGASICLAYALFIIGRAPVVRRAV
jgi:MFS family permease